MADNRTTAEYAVVVEKLEKRYGDFQAVNKVTFQVKRGEIFGFLGPNGAGKTTLIRIINRITAPDSGSVIFDGHLSRPEDIYQIGYLPEERGLYKKMKIGDQAMYLARLKGMSQAAALSSLKSWFVRFGIQAWWNKKITELSKGMAQKVQFVTTVMHNPRLLILDEPFSGFDPINVDLIRNEILRLKSNGTSVILSTHNMESVEELCDEIALINKAKLVVAGKVHDIRRIHGDNNIEILYRSSAPYAPLSTSELPFSVVSEGTKDGSYSMTVAIREGFSTNDIIKVLLPELSIVGVNEIIPRMHDIFIKLVTDKEA